MPDREHRIAAMLDAVDAVTDGAPPRVLDLAGGTGTISLRALARFPGAVATVLDQDPVLLSLARGSLAGQATVVAADLGRSQWVDVLPHRDYDAVLTATALHWLPADRVAALYAEVRAVLRPGGVFVNADHMPDDSTPVLTKRIMARADTHRHARYRTGAALSWQEWWARAAADEDLASLVRDRERIYPADHHNQEWTPPATWHVNALTAAGYAEAGVLWRSGADAAVIGLKEG